MLQNGCRQIIEVKLEFHIMVTYYGYGINHEPMLVKVQ